MRQRDPRKAIVDKLSVATRKAAQTDAAKWGQVVRQAGVKLD